MKNNHNCTNPSAAEKSFWQSVNGEAHRIAANDYYEYCYIAPSFKQWKLSTSMSKLDKLAEENEYLFQHRFSFDATEAQRKQVLEAKIAFDATDKEIRALWQSGALKIVKNEILLSVDYDAFIGSILCIISAFLVTGLGIMIAIEPSLFQTTPSLSYFVGLAILFLSVAYLFYFRPLSIMKKRGIKLGEKWYSEGSGCLFSR